MAHLTIGALVAEALINPSAMVRIKIQHLFQSNLKQKILKRFTSVGASTRRQSHCVMEVIQSYKQKKVLAWRYKIIQANTHIRIYKT